MKKSKLSKQDSELFRQSTKDVRQLPQKNKVISPSKKITVDVHQRMPPELIDSGLIDFNSDEYYETVTGSSILSFAKSGIQQRKLQQLKRGQFTIEGSLDLHGYTVQQAQQILTQFLHSCSQQELKCIQIIHGKGEDSEINPAPLKNKVNVWLRQSKMVLAFHSCKAKDGGTGAVYVLLKKYSEVT